MAALAQVVNGLELRRRGTELKQELEGRELQSQTLRSLAERTQPFD